MLKFSFKVLEPELKNQEVSATSGSCRNLSLERWHRKGGDTTEKGFLLQLDEGFSSDQEGEAGTMCTLGLRQCALQLLK